MSRRMMERQEVNSVCEGHPRDMVCLNCQAAFQCAPVLLGIKPSNLLIIDTRNLPAACRLLQDTRVSIRVLHGSFREGRGEKKGKMVLFVYRRELMEPVLRDREAVEVLQSLGYPELEDADAGEASRAQREQYLNQILARLQKRYAGYMEKRLPFPHELGVLLGYPLADVKGFMEHNGENFLYSGYWKVYANAEEAKRTFQLYDLVRKGLSELTGRGMEIGEAVRQWEDTDWRETLQAAG